MELRVTIAPGLPTHLKEPVVAFGPFEGTCAGLTIYGPSPGSSPLSRLYVDLICGRPLALTFLTRSVENLETAVAVSLFLDRELCLHPKAAALVSAVELASQLQEGGLAHVERDLARLLVFTDRYLSLPCADRAEQGRRMSQIVQWLRDYALEGQLPSLPRQADLPQVLDRGTNGFVVAEASGNLVDAVIELYREGHLRGLVLSPAGAGLERALAFKKSPYVRLDLEGAKAQLDELERLLGGSETWRVKRFLLFGPHHGTRVPRQTLIETCLRV